MIFSTTNQFICFFIFVFFGLIFGFFYSLLNIFLLKNKSKKNNNKIKKKIIFLQNKLKILKNIIFDTVFYAFFSIFYVFLLNFYNFGQFSITLIIGYILGFLITKKGLQKIVVFLKNKCYTFLTKGKTYGSKSK